MIKRRFLNFLLIALLISCNTDEPIPAFIQVEEFNLVIDDETLQGADSHEITEVSVTAAGQNIGIFSVPSEIPILEKGPTDVILSAVIKQDGQNDARVVYPFYNFHLSTPDLVSTETNQITPDITYRDDLSFWPEDFDNSISFNESVSSEGVFERTTDSELIYGEDGASAVSVMEEGGLSFYAETQEGFSWPVGQPVFLELDYSCDHIFSIGVLAVSGSELTRGDLVAVIPTQNSAETNWRKLYINLTDFVFDNASAEFFELYFRFNKSSASDESNIYLDNLKVIHP